MGSDIPKLGTPCSGQHKLRGGADLSRLIQPHDIGFHPWSTGHGNRATGQTLSSQRGARSRGKASPTTGSRNQNSGPNLQASTRGLFDAMAAQWWPLRTTPAPRRKPASTAAQKLRRRLSHWGLCGLVLRGRLATYHGRWLQCRRGSLSEHCAKGIACQVLSRSCIQGEFSKQSRYWYHAHAAMVRHNHMICISGCITCASLSLSRHRRGIYWLCRRANINVCCSAI